MNKVDFFASEYKKSDWEDFARCFTKSNIILEGIPEDIKNALVVIVGREASANWITKELKGLDNKKAIELVKTQNGCNALKAFIMRMPN